MKIKQFTFFDVLNYIFLILICFLMIYPFWQQLIISFSTPEAYYSDWYHLVPKSFTFINYLYNLQNPQTYRSFIISVCVTVSGTLLGLVMCIMAAYFLSKNWLRGRNFLFFLFVFTNFMRGGLVPFYITVDKLGMNRTYFALVIPYLIEMYYIVLFKNYFQHMTISLEESAKIDGANDFQVLARIVVPTAKPVIAAVGLFIAVRFWNDWFPGLIFIDNIRMFPLALYLRNLLSYLISTIETPTSEFQMAAPAPARAAVIMITITPIIALYPFLQKHFVKGIMLGAVKQ